MIKQSLTIINKLGLHARAATKLTSVASRFSCHITLSTKDKTVDCKSVMSLMLLAASKGTDIEIHTDGRDEIEAMDAVVGLINNRFDEAE
jgi:phosphocarrier protein HPr